MIMFFFCSQLLLKCPAGSAQPCSSMATAGGPASAAAAAPAAPTGNKKHRLSGAKKHSLKLQLATQEEERLAKEKLTELTRQLKSASYQTLLAVSDFLEETCKDLPDRTSPRCVKFFGEALNRAVPLKIVMEVLSACTQWDLGGMRSLQDDSNELRNLFLYGLGKEECDEPPEVSMSIKKFTSMCVDRYEALGCRLAGLSLDGKAQAGVNLAGRGRGRLLVLSGCESREARCADTCCAQAEQLWLPCTGLPGIARRSCPRVVGRPTSICYSG